MIYVLEAGRKQLLIFVDMFRVVFCGGHNAYCRSAAGCEAQLQHS